jgi:hypothetical protein
MVNVFLLGAFFTQRDFAPQNPQGKKPGYPLQFLVAPLSLLRDSGVRFSALYNPSTRNKARRAVFPLLSLARRDTLRVPSNPLVLRTLRFGEP